VKPVDYCSFTYTMLAFVVISVALCCVNGQDPIPKDHVALYGKCETDADCTDRFTKCDESTKTCLCIDGFKDSLNNGRCTAQEFFCPAELVNGVETPIKMGAVCKVEINNPDKHNCSADSFCLGYSGSRFDNVYTVGHCCLKAKEGNKLMPICPFTNGSLDGCSADAQDNEKCPKPTSECLSIPASDRICCPKACTGTADREFVGIASSLYCWELVKDGEPCQYPGQCSESKNCLPDKDGVNKCL